MAGSLLAGAVLSVGIQTAAALWPRRMALPAAIVGVALFLLGALLCVAAVGVGAVRAGDGQHVDVMGLFFLEGSVPTAVRRLFLASILVVAAVAVATAWRAPFGLLGALFPIGAAGLWSGVYGEFTNSQ